MGAGFLDLLLRSHVGECFDELRGVLEGLFCFLAGMSMTPEHSRRGCAAPFYQPTGLMKKKFVPIFARRPQCPATHKDASTDAVATFRGPKTKAACAQRAIINRLFHG